MDDEKVSKKDTFVFGVGLATTLLIFGLSLTLFAVRNFPDILPKVGDHLKINSGSFKPQETPPADNSNNQIQKENKVTDYTNFKIEILNATNRKGVAKDLLTKLSAKGYKDLTSDNTKENYTKNTLIAPDKDPGSLTSDLKEIGFDNYEVLDGTSIKIIIAQ